MSLGELYDELEDHITATVDDAPDQQSETFTIDTLEKADWAVRKIARERRRLAEERDLASCERARIDEWEAEQIERRTTATQYLEELLARYHRSVLDDDPKAKTIRLPSGELVSRKQPDSIVCDGGEDTIEWAEANAPELVIVKKSIDRSKAKQRLAPSDDEHAEGFTAVDPATGEVVAGLWFKRGDVRFSVKTDADL